MIRDLFFAHFGSGGLRAGRIASSIAKTIHESRVNSNIFILDLLWCCASFLFSYNINRVPHGRDELSVSLYILVVVGAIAFPAFGLYRRHPKSTSIPDLFDVCRVAAIVILIAAASEYVRGTTYSIFVSLYVTQYFVLVALMSLSRLYYRRSDIVSGSLAPDIGLSDVQSTTAKLPILLVGTGFRCDLFLRATIRDPDSTYRPIGILEDSRESSGLYFHNIPILGSVRDIGNITKALRNSQDFPHRIVLTEPLTKFDAQSMRGLIEWAEKLGIPICKLPDLYQLRPMQSEDELDIVRMDVTDLLNRPRTEVDRERLRRMVGGRRALVTGAGGSIGGELVRQLALLEPKELILADNCEYYLFTAEMDLKNQFPDIPVVTYICSVRDRNRVREIFQKHRPELVFHAAALKHVPLVEAHPCEGVLTNVIGTKNIADAAEEVRSLAMVLISSDKAVNPQNVMGATKRVAELYCRALDRKMLEKGRATRFMTVRFGNVLGSSGSVVPIFQEQIARGGPLTITDPRMERYFMTISEAVELTLLASAYGNEERTGQGEIFVLDMGPPIPVIDLAMRMIRLAGLRPYRDIPIKIVGSRPGEKLTEELFDRDEAWQESSIPGVFSAKVRSVPIETLENMLQQIEQCAREGDADRVVSLLCMMLPRLRLAKKELLAKTGAPRASGKRVQAAPQPEADGASPERRTARPLSP